MTGGLVELDEPDRPFPGRALRVPDRVVSFLLGDDAPDPALAPVTDTVPDVPWGDPSPLARAIDEGVTLAYLREPATGSGRVLAAEALRLTGHRPLVIELSRLAKEPDPTRLAAARRPGGPAGRCGDRGRTGGGAARPPGAPAAPGRHPRPLLVVGDVSWDPGWTRQPPLLVTVPAEHAGGAAHGVAVRPLRVGVRR